MLFPPLNKRNTHDKGKSVRITSERCIGEPSVRYHSKWRADSKATVSDDEPIGIGQIQLPPLYTRHMGYSGEGKRTKVKWRFYPLEAVSR